MIKSITITMTTGIQARGKRKFLFGGKYMVGFRVN
jgi:hypothetical protein